MHRDADDNRNFKVISYLTEIIESDLVLLAAVL